MLARSRTQSQGDREAEAGPARPGTSEEMLFVVSTASCACVSLSHAGARELPDLAFRLRASYPIRQPVPAPDTLSVSRASPGAARI